MAGLKPVGSANQSGFAQERPVLIPYGGGTGHIPSISFVDLLDGRVPPELLTGRHVLIGATADGLGDAYPTPTSGETSKMSGVEIQAHLLDALLRGDAITPASRGWELGTALTTIWILLLALPLLKARGNAILFLLLFFAVGALSFGLFRLANIWLPPISALTGLLFVISVEAWRERIRLRETLMRERIAAAATEGELQAGRNIQLGMLPPRADLAKIDPRLDVDALLEPARSIGGDLFDVIRIDADRIAFLVGDVTGKGVPAALFMALSKSLARSLLTRPDLTLPAAIAEINAELSQDNREAMALSLLIGVLRSADGQIDMICAGHENPLIADQNGAVRDLPLKHAKVCALP